MQIPAIVEEGELKRFGNGRGGGGSTGGTGDGSSSRDEIPRRAYITATMIALAGILMFFMAFVSAYVVRKGSSEDWRHLNVPHILWLNTAILLASSFTLARSRNLFKMGNEKEFRHWWRITTTLGIFFVIGQLIAWQQLSTSGIYLATNPASSFFYILTAAHGLHLLFGIAVLLAVAVRMPRRIPLQTATEVASLYWHFMDALWVLLFVLLISE